MTNDPQYPTNGPGYTDPTSAPAGGVQPASSDVPPPPPAYGQPSSATPPLYTGAGSPPPSQKKGLAITALVLGLVALVFCWILFLAIPVGIVAIILGIVALVKKQPKGMSITGIIAGALGTIAAVVITLVIASFVGAAINSAPEGSYSATASVSEGSASVTYGLDIGLSTESFSSDWSSDFSGRGWVATVTVTADDPGAEVSCEIVPANAPSMSDTATGTVSCVAGSQP